MWQSKLGINIIPQTYGISDALKIKAQMFSMLPVLYLYWLLRRWIYFGKKMIRLMVSCYLTHLVLACSAYMIKILWLFIAATYYWKLSIFYLKICRVLARHSVLSIIALFILNIWLMAYLMDSQLCCMNTSILKLWRVENTCHTLHFCCAINVSCALFYFVFF